MKICIFGESRGSLDEGMRNMTHYITHGLSLTNKYEIMLLDPRDFRSKNFWKKIKDFSPEIIHYLHGPTIKSFIFMKLISIYTKDSKVVMSATHPVLPYIVKEFVRLLRPDLILTQSYETEMMFKRLGCKTEPLPSGVDIDKFKPVPEEAKMEIRRKYGISEDKFIILHIGSIRENRNVQVLKELQNDDNQVIIIGPRSTGVNPKIYKSLVDSGCIVWVKYIKNIEEIYAMSDCYVYPTVSRYDFLGRANIASIEMPLTVLEAMACNIPVITTKFGALPRFFEEGNGLFFVENKEEMLQALEYIKSGIKVKTRKKVLPYSWDNITKRLGKIYETLRW